MGTIHCISCVSISYGPKVELQRRGEVIRGCYFLQKKLLFPQTLIIHTLLIAAAKAGKLSLKGTLSHKLAVLAPYHVTSALLVVSFTLRHQFLTVKCEVNYIHKLRIPSQTETWYGPGWLFHPITVFNPRLTKQRKPGLGTKHHCPPRRYCFFVNLGVCEEFFPLIYLGVRGF